MSTTTLNKTATAHQAVLRLVRKLLAVVAVAAVLVLSACSQVYVSSSQGDDSSENIYIQTFQGLPRAHWAIDDQGRPWTNRRTLHFAGTCTRGTAGLQVMTAEDSTLMGGSTCTDDGKFDWSGSVPADGTYNFKIQPIDLHGKWFGKVITISVVVDSVAPSAPIILTNAGAGFVSGVRTVTLRGTVEKGVSSMRATGSGQLNFDAAALTYDYTFELSQGETRQQQLFAINLAGTESDAAEITVSFQPGFLLSMTSFTSVHDENYQTMSEQQQFRMRTLDATTFLQVSPTISENRGYKLSSGIPGVVSRRQ